MLVLIGIIVTPSVPKKKKNVQNYYSHAPLNNLSIYQMYNAFYDLNFLKIKLSETYQTRSILPLKKILYITQNFLRGVNSDFEHHLWDGASIYFYFF